MDREAEQTQHKQKHTKNRLWLSGGENCMTDLMDGMVTGWNRRTMQTNNNRNGNP